MLERNSTTAIADKAPSEARFVKKTAVMQLRIAADRLGIDEGTYQLLSRPKRELAVHFPIEMDNGEV